MSNDNWLYEMDPDYDGQGKSKQEETDGSMMVAGCLVLMLLSVFVVVATVILGFILLG